MDELLYLIALVAGFVGCFTLWRYSKTRKKALTRLIRKQEQNEDKD